MFDSGTVGLRGRGASPWPRRRLPAARVDEQGGRIFIALGQADCQNGLSIGNSLVAHATFGA